MQLESKPQMKLTAGKSPNYLSTADKTETPTINSPVGIVFARQLHGAVVITHQKSRVAFY